MQTPKRNGRRKVLELRPLQLDAQPGYEGALELDQHGWLWLCERLMLAWREAHSEASHAYNHWCRTRDRTAYAGYRAAQDRADAAQDALRLRYAAEDAGEALAR